MRRPRKITLRNGDMRYELRWTDGHGQNCWKRFPTKREADGFAAQIDAQRRTGVVVSHNVRLEQLIGEWRAEHLEIALKPSAKKDYEMSLARIQRHFGPRRLVRSITPPAIGEFRDVTLRAMRNDRLERFDSLRAKPANSALVRARIESGGGRTVNKAIGTLRTLLKFAQGRHYVTMNAAEHVNKLRVEARKDIPKDQAVLTPAEVSRLIAATDPNWRAAIAVLAYGGLRLGELLGLQWGDVELDRGRLLVQRQLEAGTGTLREPKTKAGTRFVELPSFAINALREWKAGCPISELDLCFPGSRGGPMDDRNSRSRVFYPALRRAKLRRIRVHDLRHGAASFAISTGADIATVSRQLGHANVAITLSTYAHWFAQRTDSGLGARLDALVRKEGGGFSVVPSTSTEMPSTEVIEKWWPGSESNQRHADFQSAALPTELPGHSWISFEEGPRSRGRVLDRPSL